jgi:hypothetical protein
MQTPHTTNKILFAPSVGATSQVHEFEIPDGLFSVLVKIESSDNSLSKMEAIRGIATQLKHFLANGENFDFTRMSEEVKACAGGGVSVCATLLLGDNLFVFSTGDFYVFLKRSGDVQKLVEPTGRFVSCSGKLISGDSVCAASSQIVKLLSEAEFIKVIGEGKLSDIEADYAKELSETNESGQLLASYLLFGSEEVVSEPSGESEVVDSGPLVEEVATEELPVQAPTQQAQFKKSRFFSRVSSPRYDTRGKLHRSVVFGGVGIALLVALFLLGGRAKSEKVKEEELGSAVRSAQELLGQAQVVSGLNRYKARELVYEARNVLGGLPEVQRSTPEVKALTDTISESLGKIGGLYEVTPSIFVDATLIASNASIDQFYKAEEFLYFLSKSDNRIVKVELATKRVETVIVNDFSIYAIAANGQRIFALTEKGIKEFGRQKKDISEDVYPEGFIASFAGNLYVLDKSQSALLRYPASPSGFGLKQNWLTDGVAPDFSKSNSMAIDGAIWVFNDGGRILRFLQGNPQSVKVTTEVGEGAKMYTDETTTQVFVLDPLNKKLDVFEKSGELLATYSSDLLSEAKDFIVSTQTKEAVFSIGSKSYSFKLGHLE